ncbi:hypothetical protein [Nonomuraea gerenzanensis]|uniref:Uncharacterized protein n=1 Tax=Nonomuraea gerenzanensis TaxID=93944 RepID=A0A1M4E2H2_9ACTN|nr:hypothetical protein [Nonomuraea gerenzanensis]UBU15283.1 hypothetical protein LCN96_09725 [Nonomuraea gerenzanensis]SBO93028.1 hypothetical protein BN4615_P2542 [Nonomuraea gerenzanensis]
MGLEVQLVVTFLTLIAVPLGALALIVMMIRVLTGKLFPAPVGRWVQAAAYTALAGGAMYVWGAFHLFTLDVRETCLLQHGQGWEPGHGERFFPLSKRCNADYDLVPGYVNPVVMLCLAGVVLFAALAVRQAVKTRAAAK